jgi:hypothetical protein
MFTLEITILKDVLQQGNVYAAMYGQLQAAYMPAAGPSAGQPLTANQWVYYTGADYAAVSTLPPGPLPGFASYNTVGPYTVNLPDVPIQSAHLIFGIGCLPEIPIDSGQPQQPSPLATAGVYDFVEFTYDTSGTLYLNTTMIDQFGLPIQIQISPADNTLPEGAGVILDFADVFNQYQAFMSAQPAYLQCAQDAFGEPLAVRLLSPKYALANCVQGVVAEEFTGPPSTLARGKYYYAVTALNAAGKESFAQSDIVQGTLSTAGNAINVAWSPTKVQPVGAVSYNVYRGTISGDSITWGLIGTFAPSSPIVGCAWADTGKTVAMKTPPMNPLTTYFDTEIQRFFTYYKAHPLMLTATDGSNKGYIYSFTGGTVVEASGNTVLQFVLTSVVDSKGISVSSPPIPLQTAFNIYYPYWNSNTFDPNCPAAPDWTPYPTKTASVMVLAAQGVFADNAQQPVPTGVDTGIYGILLGSLENQIVAAITRGIANTNASPLNWGNGTAPIQLKPTLVSLPAGTTRSKLSVGTLYYYVITAVNINGETFGSFEFNAKPTFSLPCVQLNWKPFNTAQAQSFNIYRGTASQGEKVLVASVPNTGSVNSFVDVGEASATQSPPVYFPAGGSWSAYDAFFHQPAISQNGAAYAGPYDDQGSQSSTLSTASPTSGSIALGPPQQS